MIGSESPLRAVRRRLRRIAGTEELPQASWSELAARPGEVSGQILEHVMAARQQLSDHRAELSDQHAQVVAQRDETASLRVEIAALGDKLAEAGAWMAGAEALEELRRRVDQVGRLALAVHERAERWPERLERLRESEAHGAAYSEREPLVTVRIATFNRAETLCERALPSVLRQGYERWEVVVVGDACTDDTEARIAALGDERIRFHNLPVRGPYPDDLHERWYVAGIPAMNKGAAMARGAWIAPLDDDDEWDDDHLEVLVSEALDTRSELVYGRVRLVLTDPPIQVSAGTWPPRLGDFVFQGAIYNAALRDFGYDMACRHANEPGDWNLARRMWEAGVRFAFLDRDVATVHVRPRDEAAVEWFRARAAAAPPSGSG